AAGWRSRSRRAGVLGKYSLTVSISLPNSPVNPFLRGSAGEGDGPHREAVGQEPQGYDPHQDRSAGAVGEELQRAADLLRDAGVEGRDGLEQEPAHDDPHHPARGEPETGDPESDLLQGPALAGGAKPPGEPSGDSLEDRHHADDDQDRRREAQGPAPERRREKHPDAHPLEVLAAR